MNSHRKTEIIVGVLFIIATVAGVISVLSYGAVLESPADLAGVSANENQVWVVLLNFRFIQSIFFSRNHRPIIKYVYGCAYTF